MNRSTKDFAAMGRAKQVAAESAVKATKTTGSESEKSDTGFKPIDIEALKKDSEDDPLIGVIAQMQDQNKMLFDKVKELSETPVGNPASEAALERANAKEVVAMEKELDMFFNDADYKPYGEFYGAVAKDVSTWEGLTPGERANRWAVVKGAEMIMLGAEASGLDISLPEALRRAHLVVSEPLREKIFREDAVEHLKKRQKALSLRPSSKVTDEKSGKKTEDALLEVTTQRLDKVFK